MNATCHGCGAVEPTGNLFQRERIPFRGSRAYCPRCHGKLEEKVLLGILAGNLGLGLLGGLLLLLNPASELGHFGVNFCLVQLILLPSLIVHEFAHALVGQWCGLTVVGIWIGRGKTLFRARCLGFETEFKFLPMSGFAFLSHTALGSLCTDGLSLLQLLFSAKPDVLQPGVGFGVTVPVPGEGTSQSQAIVQASLRDAHSTLRPPWAKAHGYRRFLATRGKLRPTFAGN